jgi:flagellar M-ring protein FliF
MIWSRLQWSQRFTIATFALVVLGGLSLLIFFINRVDYQVLYRDLSPEDAQAIAAKLKEGKVDFLVSADGSSIQVAAPKAEVDKLRLEIAGSGLARSGRVGYEIFDKSQFGMTDFTEQVNYKRALEGELSRTISSLAEVAQARVHLVLPKDSLFEEKKEEAKASVLVRLRRGKELAQTSIAGIVNLVAGAVQGLQTYNVSLVDEQGRVLSRLMPSGDTMQTELGTGVRAQLEKEMVAKVISILEPVVGKDKVHADASIELDFNTSEQTEETYSPNPPVILSQQKSEERVGSGSGAAGIPGTRSNVDGAPGQLVMAAPERVRSNESTNYEVNKMVRHTVQPKGNIRRISVAVILDHKVTYNKDAQGKLVPAYAARTKEELDAYRQLVLAAVGYHAERGDTVTLENMPFFAEFSQEEEQAAPAWYVTWLPYLIPAMKYSALFLLFVIVYFFVFRPLRRRVYQSIASFPQVLSQAEASKALPEVKQRSLAGGTVSSGALPAAPPEALGRPATPAGAIGAGATEEEIEREFLKEAELASPGLRRFEVLKNRALEHANKEPEQLSQLIKTWIYES